MSTKIENYRRTIASLGLTEKQENELIGALQSIAENLISKKYMLNEKQEAGPRKAH